MNEEKIKDFEGGNDKFREHLNKLVARVNELTQALAEHLKEPEETVCMHNSENNKIIRVKLHAALIEETLGDIECCCYSGQGHGDA